MEYDPSRARNDSGVSGTGGKANPPYRGRLWLWITLAALFVCAVTVTVAAALGVIGTSGESDGKSGVPEGNLGVAAAYRFFSEQQDSRDRQTGDTAKEVGERLLKEPFEIESELKMGMDGLNVTGFPLSSVSLGLDAKYDMKDLGVKVSALGMEVAGAYIIDNNVVADVMGKAGSKTIDQADSKALKGNMGLSDRLHAFLPFLPKDDSVAMGLLKALAASVPDKYTKTEALNVYSPKDGKDVSMDAITTALDAAALKEISGSLKQRLGDDRRLGRELQQLLDTFAGFMGIEAVTPDDGFKRLDEAIASGDISCVSWSVYKRDGKYAGIKLACSGDSVSADTESQKDRETILRVDYTYMSEFSGNDNFIYVSSDINGLASESKLHVSWQGDKLAIEGDVTAGSGTDTDSTDEHMSCTLEFVKTGGKYNVTGDMAMEADVSGTTGDTDNMSLDMGIEADISIGGGLGTLKETRGWSDIYEKEWGKLEDLLNMFTPGRGIFNFGDIGDSL